MEVHPDDRPYAWAEVDLGAIEHNAKLLSDVGTPAALCAVVKGWGYGHGVLRSATAAVSGGASWLGVALISSPAIIRWASKKPRPIGMLSTRKPRERMAVCHSSGGVGSHRWPVCVRASGNS